MACENYNQNVMRKKLYNLYLVGLIYNNNRLFYVVPICSYMCWLLPVSIYTIYNKLLMFVLFYILKLLP